MPTPTTPSYGSGIYGSGTYGSLEEPTYGIFQYGTGTYGNLTPGGPVPPPPTIQAQPPLFIANMGRMMGR